MTVYLYVKQHAITGLKYFGKTTRPDPYKYKGSGVYWKRHINEHGHDHIITTDVWSFDSLAECQQFALEFSKINNIVDSSDWANLVAENGIDGYLPGVPRDAETRSKISKTQKERASSYTDEYRSKLESNFTSPSVRQKLSEAAKNRTQPQAVKDKISDSLKNRPKPRGVCSVCGTEGSVSNIKRWHNSNCKKG